MKLEEKEVLRYLGYRGKPADQAVLNMIHSCAEELGKNSFPRSIWRIFPVMLTDDAVLLGDLKIESRTLCRHLAGCAEAALFAATLGAPADMLLERVSQIDISRAAVLQAAAAVFIESYCDDMERQLAADAAKRGLFLRPRYSPGYGDFAITYQRDILRMLDCAKRIGLAMTDSFMLVPTKSVTAVIGLTGEKTTCHIAKCMGCTSMNCPFRKEGYDEDIE